MQDQVDLAGGNRCHRIVSPPFVDRAIHADANQSAAIAQPYPSRIVFDDRGRPAVLQSRQRIGIQRLGRAIAGQVFDHAIHPAQPGTTITCGPDGAVQRAMQAIALALEARRMPPVGAQITQAPTGDRYPQRAVGLHEQRTGGTRDLQAASPHGLRGIGPLLVPQPALGSDPMVTA